MTAIYKSFEQLETSQPSHGRSLRRLKEITGPSEKHQKAVVIVHDRRRSFRLREKHLYSCNSSNCSVRDIAHDEMRTTKTTG